ncbi:MAG TPA: DUF3800 domain-containing protein [Polyangiaceae bacterium]|jgi:hypothetical protein
MQKPESKRLRLYIDESGDHKPAREGDDFQKRYLCLVGVMFPMDSTIHVELESLKSRHFPAHHPDDPICLHRRDIIDKTGPFRALRDPDKRQAFDDDILGFLRKHKYLVIGAVVDKVKHSTSPQKQSEHPYNFGLQLLLERYAGRLLHKGHQGDVMAESRGRREDTLLRAEYIKVYDGGTRYQPAQQFQKALTSRELKLKGKGDNIAGLQIADLIAREVLIDVLSINGHTFKSASPFCTELRRILQVKYNNHTADKRIDGYGRILV